jgi:hypothetical protein
VKEIKRRRKKGKGLKNERVLMAFSIEPVKKM